MKRSAAIIGILLLAAVIACNSNNDSSSGTTTAKRTAAHVNLYGSELYIIPPEGFKVDDKTGLLMNRELADLRGLSVLGDMTNKRYEAELKANVYNYDADAWMEEDLLVNGHKARVFRKKQTELFSYYFYFTDGYSNDMAIGHYDVKDTVGGKRMYEAFKTIVAVKEDR
jgi:hypothetical protein